MPLPSLACDTHCHVFGPPETFPYVEDRTYTPEPASAQMLVDMHRKHGFSRAVVVQAGAHGTDHRALIDILEKAAGRYRGVGIVDGTVSDADLSLLDAAGIRGARLSFVAHLGSPDLASIDKVVERVARLGWHLVVHVDALSWPAVCERLSSINIPVVIDHMARIPAADAPTGTAFRLLLDFLSNENRWIKISGADRISQGRPYDDAIPAMRALVEKAKGRVLWGTDWPHPNVRSVPDEDDLLASLERAVPDEHVRRDILVDAPHRLYRF